MIIHPIPRESQRTGNDGHRARHGSKRQLADFMFSDTDQIIACPEQQAPIKTKTGEKGGTTVRQLMTTIAESRSGQAKIINWLLIIITMAGLYLTTKVNYLLFHSLIELFSIIVAATVFIITWKSVKYIENPYLIMVGISYLFIGILDLLHTLAYKGMPIFTDYDYYANQFWIAARFLESCILLVAFLFLYAKKNVNVGITFALYAVITSFIILSIFYWKIFPVCFIAGKGLTSFKIYSEYVICAILIASILLLIKNKNMFADFVYKMLLLSMVCTIISELAFTRYINNYDISNIIGHYFKLFSFMIIYRVIVSTCIEEPYQLIFRELNQINDNLREEIYLRKKTEIELESEINNHKQTEAALRESEFFFKESQSVASIGSYKTDFNTGTWESSEILNNIFGINLDYPRTIQGWLDIVHPNDRDMMDQYLKDEVIAGRKPFAKEYRIVRKSDEETRWVHGHGEVKYYGNGVLLSLIGTIQDITERKMAEEAVLESDLRFRLATEATGIGIWEWNVMTNQIHWDSQMFHIYGIAPVVDGFIQYSDWSGAVLPEELPEQERVLQNTAQRGGNNSREFHILRRDNGECRDIYAVETVRRNARGEIEWVVGTNLDITDRKRTEEQLKKSAIELQTVNSNLFDSHRATINIMQDAIIARRKADEISLELQAEIAERQRTEETLEELNEKLENRVAERTKALEYHIEKLKIETEERVQATEALREKEQMLIQQSRQAAMGEMIGNIAHQWRQPLNTLGLTIQQLSLYNDLGEFTKEFLDNSVNRSMELIKHMSQTIDDFRNYFRPDKEKVEFKVQEALASTLVLIEDSYKSQNIGVEFVAKGDLIIQGFRNEFSQVVLNILNNARDVLLEREIKDPRVSIVIDSENGRAVVTISDNAGGIPEEIIGKIFDPYFTTKGPQTGTGIGLFMSKTIIEKNMNGRLTAQNTADGAEFRIEV